MKTSVFALTALTLTLATGAASASASIGYDAKERADLSPTAAEVHAAADTRQVPARTVMTSVELNRAGISGDTLVTVSSFGTDNQVANLYRDR